MLDFFVSNEEKKRRAINEILRTYRRILQEEKRERTDAERFRQIEARVKFLEGEIGRIQGIENKRKIAEELHRLLEEERETAKRLTEDAHYAEANSKKQHMAGRKLRSSLR